MVEAGGVWHAAKCGPSINCAGQDVPNFPCNLNKRYAFGEICNLLRPSARSTDFCVARATLEPLPGLLFAPLRIRYYFRINSNSKKDPVHIDRLSDFNPRGPGSNFSVNRTRIIPLFFPLVLFSPSPFFFSLSLSFDGTTTIGEERTSMEQRSSSEIFLKGSLKKKKKKEDLVYLVSSK